MKTNKHTLLYATFSGVVFLAAFCLWFFLLNSIGRLETDAMTLVKSAATDRNKELALFSDAAVANDAAKSSGQIESFFVPANSIANLVDLIEKTALAGGVTASIDSISANPSLSAPLSPLSLKVSAIGTWSNLVAFSVTLESLPYDVVLTQVSFSKSGTDQKSLWRMDASVSSFVSN